MAQARTPSSNAARSDFSAAARSSARTRALCYLDHPLIEHRRQLDPAHEKLGPVLVGDTQRVAKTARDRQHRTLAGALQQSVGRDRGTHLDGLDRALRDRRTRRKTEQLANPVNRGIAVTLRVLGEQ